jgi:type IV secretory pathway VirB2 component (pilin)
MFFLIIVIILGIVLMIGGIATEKYGAVVVGVIVAGVAADRFISIKKKADEGI